MLQSYEKVILGTRGIRIGVCRGHSRIAVDGLHVGGLGGKSALLHRFRAGREHQRLYRGREHPLPYGREAADSADVDPLAAIHILGKPFVITFNGAHHYRVFHSGEGMGFTGMQVLLHHGLDSLLELAGLEPVHDQLAGG